MADQRASGRDGLHTPGHNPHPMSPSVPRVAAVPMEPHCLNIDQVSELYRIVIDDVIVQLQSAPPKASSPSPSEPANQPDSSISPDLLESLERRWLAKLEQMGTVDDVDRPFDTHGGVVQEGSRGDVIDPHAPIRPGMPFTLANRYPSGLACDDSGLPWHTLPQSLSANGTHHQSGTNISRTGLLCHGSLARVLSARGLMEPTGHVHGSNATQSTVVQGFPVAHAPPATSHLSLESSSREQLSNRYSSAVALQAVDSTSVVEGDVVRNDVVGDVVPQSTGATSHNQLSSSDTQRDTEYSSHVTTVPVHTAADEAPAAVTNDDSELTSTSNREGASPDHGDGHSLSDVCSEVEEPKDGDSTAESFDSDLENPRADTPEPTAEYDSDYEDTTLAAITQAR
jgi:hypothetical protein